MTDHALIVRQRAAQATLDRFRGPAFEWGRFDCGKMLAFHLKEMGHDVRLARAGAYRTALGARRAIAHFGWPSLAAALDARFPRITPAAALVGDVLALPSVGPLDAIAIALGNGRICAYHEDISSADVLQPLQIDAAWRVDP